MMFKKRQEELRKHVLDNQTLGVSHVHFTSCIMDTFKNSSRGFKSIWKKFYSCSESLASGNRCKIWNPKLKKATQLTALGHTDPMSQTFERCWSFSKWPFIVQFIFAGPRRQGPYVKLNDSVWTPPAATRRQIAFVGSQPKAQSSKLESASLWINCNMSLYPLRCMKGSLWELLKTISCIALGPTWTKDSFGKCRDMVLIAWAWWRECLVLGEKKALDEQAQGRKLDVDIRQLEKELKQKDHGRTEFCLCEAGGISLNNASFSLNPLLLFPWLSGTIDWIFQSAICINPAGW